MSVMWFNSLPYTVTVLSFVDCPVRPRKWFAVVNYWFISPFHWIYTKVYMKKQMLIIELSPDNGKNRPHYQEAMFCLERERERAILVRPVNKIHVNTAIYYGHHAFPGGGAKNNYLWAYRITIRQLVPWSLWPIQRIYIQMGRFVFFLYPHENPDCSIFSLRRLPSTRQFNFCKKV